jgi:type IV pilus assembly protein PilM
MHRVDMPMGAVVDGEIVDPSAVSSAIRELWRQPGIKGRDVVTGISNQKVVVRLIDLPFMERDELQGAIQYQAQDYIPIPIEDAILDFQIIGDYMTPGDEHMMEVLLVAAQRDMVEATVAAVEGAGLRLASIDVTSFAIVRSTLGSGLNISPRTRKSRRGDSGHPHRLGAYQHRRCGEGRAAFHACLLALRQPVHPGDQQRLEYDVRRCRAAEDPCRSAGHQRPCPGPARRRGHGSKHLVQTAQDALEREVNKFIAEVRRSLDYYLTQTTQARTIRRIYLTGSSAQLAHLDTYLEKGLQAEVVLSDPLRFIQVGSSARALAEEDRMGAAPAIGLALGGVI